MEKLSSLTPEGAPARKGKNVFNPFVESEKEAATPSFHPSPSERSEARTLQVRFIVGWRGGEIHGDCAFFCIRAFSIVSLGDI